MTPIGPIAHEFLHMLGRPGLHDLDQGGVGIYSIMSRARGSLFLTDYPGHLDSWSKLEMGWIKADGKIIRYNGKYQLRDAETSPDLNIVEMSYPEKEYQ